MDFNTEDLAQQAQGSGKETLNRMSQPIKKAASKAAREGGKKAGRAIRKGLVKVGKAVGKMAVKAGQALVKFIASLGPWGILILAIVLLLIFLFAAAFNFMQDERGSSGMMTLNPAYENPTSQTDTGYIKALALTEPQAIIDAYYKYMACNSHQKVYYDPNTNQLIDLNFSDVNETADFASLIDLYEHERSYYLSSYFIKMADELLHRDEFYYPEQIIKPVFAKMLPLESDSSKKYITTLPIVDDGSDTAKAMREALQTALGSGSITSDIYNSLTNAYAINESLDSEDGQTPKVKYNEDADYALLALSKGYETSTIYNDDGIVMKDANGTDIQMLKNQGSNYSLGVWDYGFGSILQYEPMEQDKYISCTKASFTYHLHVLETWTDEENNEHQVDSCLSTLTCDVSFGVDTVATITQRINDSVPAAWTDTEDHTYTPYIKFSPSSADLTTMLANPNHVEMKVISTDKNLAGRIFDNDVLQNAFGNGDRTLMTMAEKYPLKVAVLSSVATFSGNIRYVYEDVETAEELTDRTGNAATFAENWSDDCTKVNYAITATEGCMFQGVVTRAGQVNDKHPAVVEELKVPVGFQYLEAYDSHYQIYVPDTVNEDLDFRQRVTEPLVADSDYAQYADQDMDGDGKITGMDYMLQLGLLQPYFGGALGTATGSAFSYTNLSANSLALMQQVGCTADENGEIELLAKAIAAEAGPNKLDQLMVGAVVVNRVHSSVYPNQNSIIEVLSARGQYSTWPDRIKNANPTDEMRASARQVLSGEFATPSNIIFQAGFTQGDGTFLINVNGHGLYTHYYCYKGAALSTIDIFGRPAITNESELRSLAEQLHQKDIDGGVSTSTGASGITTPGQTTNEEITSEFQLFAANKFDTISAIQRMQNIAEKQRSSVSAWSAFIAGFQEMCSKIFDSTAHVFNFNSGMHYVSMFNHNVALDDMQNTVIQAVTFINQDTYSTVADDIDPNELQFIFVGDYGGLGMSTMEGSANMVPGVGSTFTGFGSPTTSHYNVAEPWTGTTGQAVVAVSEGETVIAVGTGTVTAVSSNNPYEVVMSATADGKNLVITYGNLADISVSVGQSLSKGTTVGHAGPGGLILKLTIDGENVNPMDYFYRPQYGSGIGFTNLLDASGNIDNSLVQALKETLNTANSNITNSYDIYHTSWRSGGKSHQSVGECTWWAYGRGLQYCETNGTLPANGFKNGYGNGGDFLDQAQSQFNTGKIAQAGSWIVWKNGSWGHVAFVEAVANDGSIVISQSGRGYWDYYKGAGVNVSTIKNTGTASSPNYRYGSGYTFVGFVYLSSPK